MNGLRHVGWGDCPYLLAQEITDFQSTAVLLDDAVDREMCIYRPHFVLEALRPGQPEQVSRELHIPDLRNALDHIRNETPDCS